MKTILMTPTLIVFAVFAAGCTQHRNDADLGATHVAIAVTERGFEPATITVPTGKPVTLTITRKTDRTCVKDFVIAERGIKRALPLNRAVEITFTPEKPGTLRYACAMDMIAGTMRVE